MRGNGAHPGPSPLKRPRRSDEEDDEDDPSGSQRATLNQEEAHEEDVGVPSDPYDPYEYDGVVLSQLNNPTTPIIERGSQSRNDVRVRFPKTVNDRVHGPITLPGLLVAAMDTPEFQRLDKIRQLGGCSYVYPSATHTRKEHSIGVAYLAGLMVRHLRAAQSDELELGISENDILCVELAGLVHDLGHGPFSHMFETFMAQQGGGRWEHEEMSGKLLREIVSTIPLRNYFQPSEEEGAEHSQWPTVQCEEHIEFVVKLIEGLKDSEPWPPNIGRPEGKRFLFDIVANSRNGIDVDKLDYLVRDSMAAFGCSKLPGFDIHRIIESSKVVIPKDKDGKQVGPSQVGFQQKVAMDINEIFGLRAKMHRQVYQHRTANVAEAMITDVFVAANATFRMRGPPQAQPRADSHVPDELSSPGSVGGAPASEPRPLTLDEAARHPASFMLLTDSIIDTIDTSLCPGLEKARHLIERLKRRDFYKELPYRVKLPLLPLCANCGKPTQIEWAHCASCGLSTKSRLKKPKKPGSNVHVPEGIALTAETAKEGILNVCPDATRLQLKAANDGRGALYVKIVNVTHGKSREMKDPHGIAWEVFDPLAKVSFFNPKDDPPDKVIELKSGALPGIALPSACRDSVLYCYLTCPGPAGNTWETDVNEALRAWGKGKGNREHMGTSNKPSPGGALRHSSRSAGASGGGSGSARKGKATAAVRSLMSGDIGKLPNVAEQPVSSWQGGADDSSD